MTTPTDTAPAPQDAAPAATPDATVDPTWRVVTAYGIIEVQATDLDVEDNDALLFFNDAAVTKENEAGTVAAIQWDGFSYAIDTRFGTVIEAPVVATPSG